MNLASTPVRLRSEAPRRPAAPPADPPDASGCEHTRLVLERDQLRRALEAKTLENIQLQLSLAEARAENRQLRAGAARPAYADRRSHIRRMLSERSSRNP